VALVLLRTTTVLSVLLAAAAVELVRVLILGFVMLRHAGAARGAGAFALMTWGLYRAVFHLVST